MAKRSISVALVWLLLIFVPVVGAEPAQAAGPAIEIQIPGHAVDVNVHGDLVLGAVKEAGRLYTRTRIADVWSDWQAHGRDNWLAVDVTIDDDGDVALVGLKESGTLFTRRQVSGASWGSWTQQGRPFWSTRAVPSIDSYDGRIEIAAVKSSGKLYTRSHGSAGWEGWVKHGRRDWSQVDISVHAGVSWIAGVKQDGRLYTRMVSPEPGQWQLHGSERWSRWTTPSIAIFSGEIAVAAVKDNGRSYIRTGTMMTDTGIGYGDWDPFGSPVTDDDAVGIAIDIARDRVSAAVSFSDGGLVITGLQVSAGQWVPLSQSLVVEASGFSVTVAPSVAVEGFHTSVTAEGVPVDGGDIDAVLVVKEDGSLWLFEEQGVEREIMTLGRPTWAADFQFRQS